MKKLTKMRIIQEDNHVHKPWIPEMLHVSSREGNALTEFWRLTPRWRRQTLVLEKEAENAKAHRVQRACHEDETART